uniref:Putative single-strand selective monofunctional uracil dna glycosylase n=1 Tax=Ixodes ricinus TaxID=34613 RepID=A0A0K8R4Y9_IXORI
MATCSDVASEYLCIERKQCELLLGIPYGDKVSHVYSPVDYARETHECFVRKYCTGAKTVIFLGMNPGPFGMAQNGVRPVEFRMALQASHRLVLTGTLVSTADFF